MDLSGMPMQSEQANALPNMEPTPAQQAAQNTRTNAFGQNVFMGVSISIEDLLSEDKMTNTRQSSQVDPKTASGEGYAMGFLLPKRDP